MLAASGGYSAGATGGEATHKLTVAEMPSHNHGIAPYSGTHAEQYNNIKTGAQNVDSMKTGSAGGNVAHNNMPPYLAVYMWKRTA